ncbi:GNAT family N-acetyltransferase [Nevskia soli]|uniref:GNAT family N-acetyltransferase n=1 Tax=Nevskia soli TaxID=418856 RepID=UPI00068CAF46|nr:GNAT family N-acetyltransferase [Nevskia soli]
MHALTLDSYLDNPVWYSLAGEHSDIAEGEGQLRGYRADHAPFLAVESNDVVVASSQGAVGRRYFLGPSPKTLPSTWRLVSSSNVLQMFRQICSDPLPQPNRAIPLTMSHRSAMGKLTAIAFPDFFRQNTADLGTYVGIEADGHLVAMAGERMSVPGAREISGICTDPAYTGRGYGLAVTTALIAQHSRQGVASFLHVSESNAGAIRLYEKLGFQRRAVLKLTAVEISER